MKYCGSLYSIKDKETTLQFYKNLFGLKMIQDFGTNFTLTGGLSFQTHDSWKGFIEVEDKDISYGGNDAEIYIETDDLAAFVEKANQYKNLNIVHPLKEHEWGQRGLRFYDPDLHIIEVSETLDSLCKRLSHLGMTNEEIYQKTGLSVKMVARMLQK